jgi:hypothetical protein
MSLSLYGSEPNGDECAITQNSEGFCSPHFDDGLDGLDSTGGNHA